MLYFFLLTDKTRSLQSEVDRLKEKDLQSQSEIQRLQGIVVQLEKVLFRLFFSLTIKSICCHIIYHNLLSLYFQRKANIELELNSAKMKYENEVASHKETIARFNADKKQIITTSEEANEAVIKGRNIRITDVL